MRHSGRRRSGRAEASGRYGRIVSVARDLGHTVTPLYPCLVPIKCKNAFAGGLKGIRVRARGVLTCAGRRLGSRRANGCSRITASGIPALQLSCLLWKLDAPYEIQIDFSQTGNRNAWRRFSTRGAAYVKRWRNGCSGLSRSGSAMPL